MEAFQLLSRGGARFDKTRFRNDFKLFIVRIARYPLVVRSDILQDNDNLGSKNNEPSAAANLPAELDFFKHPTSASGDRKAKSLHKKAPSESGSVPSSDEESDPQPCRRRYKKPKLEEDKQEGSSTMNHRVTAKGEDVPEPLTTFEDLDATYDAPSLLLQNLQNHGFEAPTPIQSYGIPILMKKRDLAAISPTGTGKTLSYLVPIFASLKEPISKSAPTSAGGARAIIIAPTRELAHQIHNECLKLGQGRKWRIVLLSRATASTLSDKAVRDNVDIIVSTPLRLLDSVTSRGLELNNARFLILDEADRLLDAEFMQQTQEIIAACDHPDIQRAVFSATLPSGAEKVALHEMKRPIRIVVGLKDTPLPSISQSVVYVADESSKLPTLLAYLSQPYAPPIVIFTATQPRAASLSELLVLNNLPNVDCLHAGMTQRERESVMSRMRNGDSWVMVSTEVMARGLDFKGVCGVINFDFPTSVQSYVHRIGRTGRAGREGTAITYFADEDAPYLKSIANVMLQSGSAVPEWMLKLPKPSRMKRRQMGKVQRGDHVSNDSHVGRAEVIKQRDMARSTKRQKRGSGGVTSTVVGED